MKVKSQENFATCLFSFPKGFSSKFIYILQADHVKTVVDALHIYILYTLRRASSMYIYSIYIFITSIILYVLQHYCIFYMYILYISQSS